MKAKDTILLNRLKKYVESQKEGGKVKFYREDDDMGGAEDQGVFVHVDTGGDQDVLVGPFDSPEAAQSAAGSDDVNLVTAEVEPAAGGEGGEGGENEMPPEQLTGMEGEMHEKIVKPRLKDVNVEDVRKQVLADIFKEDVTLDVDTSVAQPTSNADQGSTAQDAGSLASPDTANTAKVSQPASDAGKETPVDQAPGDSPSNAPGFEGIPDVPKKDATGGLDSHGGDLGTGMHEQNSQRNPKSVAPGSYVRIYKRNTKEKVDSGIVKRVGQTSITMEGDVDYPMDSFDYVQLTH